MIKKLRETYQLKVGLKGIRPPVWRRFLVENTESLDRFHHAIQIVMGWTNSHLHQYVSGDKRYGINDPDLNWDDGILDESEYKVKDLLRNEGDTILYEYDFGDGWEHKITLEKILPFDTAQVLPCCIKGRRGCPPEDVGGVWGYEDFLSKWSDSTHPEHEEIREWSGEVFHPEEFSNEEVNEILTEVFEDL